MAVGPGASVRCRHDRRYPHGWKTIHRRRRGDAHVERIEGEAGAKVEFTDVLMVGDKVGKPTVAGAKVVGSIV